MKNRAGQCAAFLLGLLLVALLLQCASSAKQDSLVFPSLPAILRAFFQLLTRGATYRLIGTTLLHLFISLSIASLIGLALGWLEGSCRSLRVLFTPLMTLFRSIPLVVLVVVVMVLAAYRLVPYIVSVIILIPIISEAACEGYLHIDRELKDICRLNGGVTCYSIFHVYLPLMAGYIRQAYINAVGMGIKIIVSAEYLVQTKNSLGKAVNTSIYFSDYQNIYAYALIMILLVVLLSELPLFLLSLQGTRKSAKIAP